MGFSKQLDGNHQERYCRRLPIPISSAAAVSTGFSFSVWFFFVFNEFPPGMPAGSRYEYATRLFRRFEETFERDQDGESDICSDVVLRGLAIRVMGALCR